MDKLIEGSEESMISLQCPHCDEEECYPGYMQPELFECVHVSPRGTIHVWLCKKCKRHFYTRIE